MSSRPNSAARSLRERRFQPRVVRPRKGRGSYRRKGKEKKYQEGDLTSDMVRAS